MPHAAACHAHQLVRAGVIQSNGMVKCAQSVGGPVNHECSLSEYEKLGNSKERRPGENIHLTNFSLALKARFYIKQCLADLIAEMLSQHLQDP